MVHLWLGVSIGLPTQIGREAKRPIVRVPDEPDDPVDPGEQADNDNELTTVVSLSFANETDDEQNNAEADDGPDGVV